MPADERSAAANVALEDASRTETAAEMNPAAPAGQENQVNRDQPRASSADDASRSESPENPEMSARDHARFVVQQFEHAAKHNAPVTPSMLGDLRKALGFD